MSSTLRILLVREWMNNPDQYKPFSPVNLWPEVKEIAIEFFSVVKCEGRCPD
jgi:hypothetical protein